MSNNAPETQKQPVTVDKIKSKETQKALQDYKDSREKYFKAKNKWELTDDQKKGIDAEYQKKIDDVYTQQEKTDTPEDKEKMDKEKEKNKLTDIQSWLNKIDISKFSENLDPLTMDENNLKRGIQWIQIETKKYVDYNQKLQGYAGNVSETYGNFMDVISLFEDMKSKDTRWSGDSSYKDKVGDIQTTIDKLKTAFKQAKDKVNTATTMSKAAGILLNDWPDNLRKKERDNAKKTETQNDAQKKEITKQKDEYVGQQDELTKEQTELEANKKVLEAHKNQIDAQKTEVAADQTKMTSVLSTFDVIKNTYGPQVQEAIKSNCGGKVLTDEQLVNYRQEYAKNKMLPPDAIIDTQKLTEVFARSWDIIATYVQTISNYAVIQSMAKQLEEWASALNIQEADITKYNWALKSHMDITDKEIGNVKWRIENMDKSMDVAKEEGKWAEAHYAHNIDQLDELDMTISSSILNNDINNNKIEKNIDSYVTSIENTKVEAKWGWAKAWDSTGWLLCKWVRDYVISPVKDAILFLPNQLQKLADASPNVGLGWVLKNVLNPLVQLPAGIAEWVINLADGVVGMVEHPVQAVAWLGSLVGRDPMTGNRSRETAGQTWLNFGKAFIAYDDRGNNAGRAAGKAASNILLTILPFLAPARVAGAVGEVAEATQLAKVAQVSRLGRLGIRAANVAKWTAEAVSDVAKWTRNVTKWVRESAKNIPATVKKWLWYVPKTVKNFVRESGWIGKTAVKLWKWAVELGTGYRFYKGVARMVKGESFIAKTFPWATGIEESRIAMETRLNSLASTEDKVGQIEKTLAKVKDYVDPKSWELLPQVKVPLGKWRDIADYKNLLNEEKYLKAQVAEYKTFETLLSSWETPTKLGEFVKEYPEFGNVVKNILQDPANAEKYLTKFQKKYQGKDFSKFGDIQEIITIEGNPLKLTGWKLMLGDQEIGLAKGSIVKEVVEAKFDKNEREKLAKPELKNIKRWDRMIDNTWRKWTVQEANKLFIDIKYDDAGITEWVKIENIRILEEQTPVKINKPVVKKPIVEEVVEAKFDKNEREKLAKPELKNIKRWDRMIDNTWRKWTVSEANNRFIEIRYDDTGTTEWVKIENIKILEEQEPIKVNKPVVKKPAVEEVVEESKFNKEAREKLPKLESKDIKIGDRLIDNTWRKWTVQGNSPGVCTLKYDGAKVGETVRLENFRALEEEIVTKSPVEKISLYKNLVNKINKIGSYTGKVREIGAFIKENIPTLGKKAALVAGIGLFNQVMGRAPNDKEKVNLEEVVADAGKVELQDQEEIKDLQALLDKNPTSGEIKNFVREHKPAFRELLLKNNAEGTFTVDFSILSKMEDYKDLSDLSWNIDQQKSNRLIAAIGLWDILEEGQNFTVTTKEGDKKTGVVKDNRAMAGSAYVPVWQGDIVSFSV